MTLNKSRAGMVLACLRLGSRGHSWQFCQVTSSRPMRLASCSDVSPGQLARHGAHVMAAWRRPCLPGDTIGRAICTKG